MKTLGEETEHSVLESQCEDNTLALMQAVSLDMIRLLHEFCKNNNLEYFLAFGSLLGAVRHQGFIPWDDDIDVVMPRLDYDKLVSTISSNLPDDYEFQNYRLGNSVRYVSRLVDKRVTIRLQSYTRGNDYHPWLDIFPLDGVPGKGIRRTIHQAKVMWHLAACAFASFDTTVNLHRPGRPWWQQLIINFASITHFGSLLSPEKALARLNKCLTEYPYGSEENVMCCVGTYRLVKQTWSFEAFSEPSLYKFGKDEFYGPSDYDAVLKTTYGDYLTPPNADERKPHRVEVIENNYVEQ